MKPITWRAAGALGLILSIYTVPARAGTECPFGNVGQNVLLAFSLESWNALWELSRAPGLGQELAVSIREELIPAILEQTGATEEFQTHLEDFEKLSERIEWEGLAKSQIDVVVGSGEDLLPRLAVRLIPPKEALDSSEGALVELFKFAAEESSGAVQWKEEGKTRFLALTEMEDIGPATEAPRLYLSRYQEALWITLGHEAEEAAQGPGLAAREGFTELWSMSEVEGGVSLVLDFGACADLARGLSDLFKPETTASLILDETMEALFKDDQETLKKLKMADEGMAFWSEQLSGEPAAPEEKGLALLESLGLLVYRSGAVEGGVLGDSYWRPVPGGEGAALLDLKPLSGRSLALLDTGLVEVGLQSLPDFGRLYDALLDLVGSTPEGKEALLFWEDMQDNYGFHLKKDLFTAIGGETAWVTRQVPKEGTQSFPIATNELYVFQQIGDASTANGLLRRLEDLLKGQGIPVSHKQVGEATFTEVDTMFLGKAMWGLLEDPPALIFAKGSDPEFLDNRIARYRAAKPGDLSEHPRWESLQSIWKEDPTAVTLQNAGLVQNQIKGQLQGAQMMIAMMGMGDPVVLAVMGLAMQMLNGLPTPDWYFRVDHNEGEVRISRALLVYPLEEAKN